MSGWSLTRSKDTALGSNTATYLVLFSKRLHCNLENYELALSMKDPPWSQPFLATEPKRTYFGMRRWPTSGHKMVCSRPKLPLRLFLQTLIAFDLDSHPHFFNVSSHAMAIVSWGRVRQEKVMALRFFPPTTSSACLIRSVVKCSSRADVVKGIFLNKLCISALWTTTCSRNLRCFLPLPKIT